MESKPIPSRILLRSQIQGLRIYTDNQSCCFIPQKSLYNLLTMDKIRLALTNCNDIPPYHIDELVETILRGGRKIFAILVLLKGEEKHISRFVRSDGFQRRALDNKLPFSEEALDQMLPQDAVHDFYRLQWEFLAPTFAKGILHRVLDPRICLPFLRQRDTEKEGGFGHIYEVEIHPEHSQLPLALDGEVCEPFTTLQGTS